MVETKLRELRRQLVHGETFIDTVRASLDVLETEPCLVEGSAAHSCELLDAVATATGEAALGPNARLQSARWMRNGDHGLVHGSFVVDGRQGLIVYFEDLELGMASIATGRDHFVHCARFFLGMKAPAAPSSN